MITFKENSFKEGAFKKLDFTDCILAQPVTESEWGQYHHVRRTQTGDPLYSEYDPNHEVFTHKDHFHFVFYKDLEIIGMAQVQSFNEAVCAIISMAIDTPYQKQGYGTHFLRLIERWIHNQGRTTIQIHSELKTVKFYEKSGYVIIRLFPTHECILAKWLN